jgi:hypothetical protein
MPNMLKPHGPPQAWAGCSGIAEAVTTAARASTLDSLFMAFDLFELIPQYSEE